MEMGRKVSNDAAGEMTYDRKNLVWIRCLARILIGGYLRRNKARGGLRRGRKKGQLRKTVDLRHACCDNVGSFSIKNSKRRVFETLNYICVLGRVKGMF